MNINITSRPRRETNPQTLEQKAVHYKLLKFTIFRLKQIIDIVVYLLLLIIILYFIVIVHNHNHSYYLMYLYILFKLYLFSYTNICYIKFNEHNISIFVKNKNGNLQYIATI